MRQIFIDILTGLYRKVFRKRYYILPSLYGRGMGVGLLICLLFASCSNKKNTAQTRWWQAFTAKYNTYYNGSQAYIDASLEKENGNKDNYTEMLPLYTVGNKASREIGKSHYETAIEKCQKTIKLHPRKPRKTDQP